MDLGKELNSIRGNTITRKNANALFDRYIQENVGATGLKLKPLRSLFIGELRKKFTIK
jgi:hypothetical protein